MFVKYNPMKGIALFFEPHEIEEGCIFLQVIADGFAQGDNPKMRDLGNQLDGAVKTIKSKEGGYFV